MPMTAYMSAARMSRTRALWATLLLAAGWSALGCDPDRRRLERELRSPSPAVRAAAIQTLARKHPREAARRLGRYVADPSPGVRLAAVRALAHLRGPRVRAALLRAVRDADPDVRLATARALAAFPGTQEALLGLLEDPDPVVRHAARKSLVALGMDERTQVQRLADRAFEKATKDLASPLPAARAAAVRRLAASGRPEAAALLERVLRDESPNVVAEALAGLAEMGTKQALDALGRSLDPGVPGARRACRILAQKPLERWLHLARTLPGPLFRVVLQEWSEAPPNSEALAGLCDRLSATVCRSNLETAIQAGRLARKAGCSWPKLQCPEDPVRQAVIAWLRRDRLTPALQARLLALWRKEAPPKGLGPLLGQAPSDFQRRLLRLFSARLGEFLEANRPWPTDEQWARLDRQPEAGPIGQKPAPPADPKAKELAKLLSRFPPRAWRTLDLIPSNFPLEAAIRLLEAASWLEGSEELLARMALSGPRRTRLAALVGLGVRRREAGPLMVRAVRRALGGDVSFRTAAVAALAACGDRGTAMLQAVLLRDPSSAVREAAALALAKIGGPRARAALRQALARRAEPGLAEAASLVGDGEAAAPLLAALQKNPGDIRLRLSLVRALGKLGSAGQPGLVAALVRNLGHPDPRLRAAAALALGRLKAHQARGELQACTADYDLRVRLACKKALDALGGTRGSRSSRALPDGS